MKHSRLLVVMAFVAGVMVSAIPTPARCQIGLAIPFSLGSTAISQALGPSTLHRNFLKRLFATRAAAVGRRSLDEYVLLAA